MRQDPELADVAIIGGGPAGLSAALLLSRARRRIVVIDDGQPRNATAPHMHGVLGHDGLSPLRLLELGRKEVARYGGRLERATVSTLHVGDRSLEVTTKSGGRFRARRALVATGLSDELPAIPGMREQWGRGVVVCPYCDGWEHRHDVVGVVATSERSTEQAQLLRQWSERIVYFPDQLGEPDAAGRKALVDRGIRIERGDITGLRIEEDRVSGVRVDGRIVPVGVVFTAPRQRPQDSLLRALGATRTEDDLGDWIAVDDDGRTSVPGVYAVGNVVNARSNVSVSLGLGTLVGGAITLDLLGEDIARALSPRSCSFRLHDLNA